MVSCMGSSGKSPLRKFTTLVAISKLYLTLKTFMTSGTPVFWPLIGIELCGIVAGSWLGPITSKYIPDIWLKRLFIVIAFIVGINYVLRGFFGMRLW